MPPTGPLRAEAFTDATVMPFTRFTRQNGRPGLRMGVFDAQGKVVPNSLLRRSFGKVGFAAAFTAHTRDTAARDPRTVIFGGRLSRHFGHFLLESLAKAWYAKQHPELPVVWAWPADRPEPGYSPWQAAVFEVLGLINEPVFVSQPTRFGQVVVPDSGYRIKDFFAPQQAAFLAAYPARRRDPGRRVWLSRARVDGGVIHAPRLEGELAAAGWSVVRPETLALTEQLELLATATRVAGDEGSAFHLLALLADVQGLRVDIFCRHPDRTVEQQNANYQTIADARSLDQHMHVLPEEVLIGSRSTKVTKLATTLAGYRQILDIDPEPVGPSGPAAGLDLARELADAADVRTCLELTTAEPIGLGLGMDACEVVSPAFGFDPRARTGQGVALYEMPPAEYFEHLLAPEHRFDLIVLRGGTEEETAAWLERARSHAHAGTRWLIAGEPGDNRASLGRLRRDVADGIVWSVIGGPHAAGDAT